MVTVALAHSDSESATEGERVLLHVVVSELRNSYQWRRLLRWDRRSVWNTAGGRAATCCRPARGSVSCRGCSRLTTGSAGIATYGVSLPDYAADHGPLTITLAAGRRLPDRRGRVGVREHRRQRDDGGNTPSGPTRTPMPDRIHRPATDAGVDHGAGRPGDRGRGRDRLLRGHARLPPRASRLRWTGRRRTEPPRRGRTTWPPPGRSPSRSGERAADGRGDRARRCARRG